MTDNFIKGDRGVAGERGERGDHGQDGRQGIQGLPGEAGMTGRTGRRGPSILYTDRRMVILFLYNTLAVTCMYFLLDHNQSSGFDKIHNLERQLVANCHQQNTAAVKFDAFIDQAITNARNTIGLTPAQKRQSIAAESALHQPIQHCPPKP